MSAEWLDDTIFDEVLTEAVAAPLEAIDQLIWCLLHTEGILQRARANAALAALHLHPVAQDTLTWLVSQAPDLWRRVQETQAVEPGAHEAAYISLEDVRWFLSSVAWLRLNGHDNPMLARYTLYLNWERETPEQLIVSSFMNPHNPYGFGVLLGTDGCDPWSGLPDHLVPESYRQSWDAGHRFADATRAHVPMDEWYDGWEDDHPYVDEDEEA